MSSQIEVLNPATGLAIGTVDNASIADCLHAVDMAHDAFVPWKNTAPRVRAEILRKAFDIMIAEQEELARTITLEMGKVLSDARAEVAYAAEFFRWFSEEAVRIDGDYRRAPSGSNWLLVSRGPALAAGCTVVLKPAHDTPLTALAIADILRRAGVPHGVVNVVVADPPGPAVEAMLNSGKVRKLSFTGSTRVGSLLLAQAAQHVINCSMELGGNAPLIVCADADIDVAVDGAMLAKMRNGGAACTAANRFYVHDQVLSEFTDKFTARMAALQLGDGLDPSTTLGPLVSRAQQQRVADAVAGAVSRGAKVLCGGSASTEPAFGYQATVLAEVSPHDEILQDEIFGPVAALVSYSDEQEMLSLANNVEHGLVGYVFTRDASRGMRIAEALETGMVGFNRGLVSDPSAPFGGVKASGIGREGGHDGLLAFLETKYVAGNW